MASGSNSECPYTILLKRIKDTHQSNLMAYAAQFRLLQIHESVVVLSIRKTLDNWMVLLLRQDAVAAVEVDRLEPNSSRWQTGLDMLIYAINNNPKIDNIELDLSGCSLIENHLFNPLKWLSHFTKHINYMNLSANNFTGAGVCFLFENLWDGHQPTFDTIDCQFNIRLITVEDIKSATKKHPECMYVLHTIAKDRPLRPGVPKYRGTFIISGASTATYYIRNGIIQSLDSVSAVSSTSSDVSSSLVEEDPRNADSSSECASMGALPPAFAPGFSLALLGAQGSPLWGVERASPYHSLATAPIDSTIRGSNVGPFEATGLLSGAAHSSRSYSSLSSEPGNASQSSQGCGCSVM